MSSDNSEYNSRQYVHRLAVDFACGDEDWSPAEKHKRLNDLVSAIREYQQNHPVPVAERGFGWRVFPALPEPDIEVLLCVGGNIWTGVLRSASGKWCYNNGEVRWQPDAWSYIPEAP